MCLTQYKGSNLSPARIFISAIPFKCIFYAGSARWRSLKNVVYEANGERTKEIYSEGIMYATFIMHTIHSHALPGLSQSDEVRLLSSIHFYLSDSYSWSFGINKALWEITTKEKCHGYFYLFIYLFWKKERCSWFFLYHLKSLSHYVT